MSGELAPARGWARGWVSALAAIGAVGTLITVTSDPMWPQIVMLLGVLIVLISAWSGTAAGGLWLGVVAALAPALWQCWELWQGRWTISGWLVLTVIAVATLIPLSLGAARRASRSQPSQNPDDPGHHDENHHDPDHHDQNHHDQNHHPQDHSPWRPALAVGAVLALSLGVTLGGGALLRGNAEDSELAATPMPFLEGLDHPGASPYVWGSHRTTRQVETAYGAVRLEWGNPGRLVGTPGLYRTDPVWTFALRPYEVVDMVASSSGEIVMVQLTQPEDAPVHTEISTPVLRVWLDASTGAVLDSIRWDPSGTPQDSGEDAATAATGRDWVIYEPMPGDIVTYQDVLVGQHRIDTWATVGLTFRAGQPQEVDWVRDRPEECAEHVLWWRDSGRWVLAADATTVAVARVCLDEPDEDGIPQVAVSLHGVDSTSGQDAWVLQGPQPLSFPDWTASSPDSAERVLDEVASSMPTARHILRGIEVTHGTEPTDPVMLSFTWGSEPEAEPVTIDLATGQ